MKSLPTLKWFVILLLPVTFSWKLAVGPNEPYNPKQEIELFLRAQKFDYVELRQQFNSMPVIRATVGACRMFVLRVTPFGTERDLTHTIAAKTDRVFLVFQGQVHADQSSWRIGVEALWSKALYRLRLSHHESAVIAIAAKPVCKAERFPWGELREL